MIDRNVPKIKYSTRSCLINAQEFCTMALMELNQALGVTKDMDVEGLLILDHIDKLTQLQSHIKQTQSVIEGGGL